MSRRASGPANNVPPRSPIAAVLASARGTFIGVGLFSGLINALALTGSLYMLQVYDRVLPSRSVPTLVGLTILLVMLYAGQGLLDLFRTRLMSRIGLRIDRALREKVFGAVLLLPPACARGWRWLATGARP